MTGHEIRPAEGTMYREGMSLPVRMADAPWEYPAEAVCAGRECGVRITKQDMQASWQHAPRAPEPAPGDGLARRTWSPPMRVPGHEPVSAGIMRRILGALERM